MIEKILSAGRLGSERAALDVAVELGIPVGGAVPAEAAEGLPSLEGLTPLPGQDFQACLERNVIDSDGTLLISFGRPEGDTDLARRLALRHRRQLLHVEASASEVFPAADLIRSWIDVYRIAALHVTGIDRMNPEGLYGAAVQILALCLESMPTRAPNRVGGYPLAPGGRPATLGQAVRRLELEMTLRDKAVIANTEADNADRLFASMVRSVVVRFGLSGGNELLVESCRASEKQPWMNPEEAAMAILRALWRSLRATYRIRVIK
ncbi:MAG: putative molybdenum carrier protein [Desulfobacterales bacterium]|jgi:hypothetical protein